jgi:adenylate cyclase
MCRLLMTEIVREPAPAPVSHTRLTMTTKVKRRLTSILCADVKSYSRLMESDETRTIGTLRQYRAAMDALVERHDGRTINTWGDAVIAEFASVVEAVQCAIEVQRELAGRNRELPEAEQMWFRIGINLGDVMVENDDLYGEGVNIAARLQELAEPGGILVSGPVYEQVHRKVTIGFDFIGHQQVKNVSSPVMSYRVTLSGTTSRPGRAPPGPAQSPPHPAPAATVARSRPEFLPRPIAVALALSVFLFSINAFTGFREVWFQWPTAGLLLVAVLRVLLRRR